MRIIIFLLLPLLSGCMSASFLQDSNILDPATIRGGIGVTYLGHYGPLMECSGRVGIVRDLDMGIKFGINLMHSNSAIKTDYAIQNCDIRYQLVNNPIRTIIGIGLSNFVLGSYPSNGDDVHVLAFQPFVLIGQTNWYFAIRPYYSYGNGIVNHITDPLIFEKDRWSTYALTVGGSFPIAKSHILLEFNYFRFINNQMIIIPAIGLQTDF